MSDGSSADSRPTLVIDLARGRSGDKADLLNVGIIADDERAYSRLEEQLTAEVVADRLDGLVDGDVTRHTMPNVLGFNYLVTEALGGGGQISIRYDTQGKTYAAIVLETQLPAWEHAERNPSEQGES